MTALYRWSTLAFLFLAALVAAFFYGSHVRADHDRAAAASAQRKADAQIARLNERLQIQDTTAANRIAALNAQMAVLSARIATTPLTEGHTYVPPVSPACPSIPNPLSSPEFRLLYDAGSRPSAGRP